MFEDVPSLSPVSFFRIEWNMPYAETLNWKKHTVPSTDHLHGEDTFADVAMAWNEKALLCSVKVKKSFEDSFFPDLVKGDSFELFIDTRDLKSAGSVTRFCHHFAFFPKEPACEITKMRLDDSRPLADPNDLIVDAKFGVRSYALDIIISADALYGYDPLEVGRLGVSYRVNRFGGDPQHFNLSSHEYSIEKHPSLWARFLTSKNA